MMDEIKTRAATEKISAIIEVNKKKLEEKGVSLLYNYSKRFSVYEDDEKYYCIDRYWATIKELGKKDIKHKKNLEEKINLFVKGFLPFTMEVENFKIRDEPLYPGDNMFWQFPNLTEKDFYEKHRKITENYYDEKKVDIYIPMPWATFIDIKKYNIALIEAIGSRIKQAALILRQYGVSLNVHTCCQHIRWNECLKYCKKLGVTDLWISHKTKKENFIDGINLHAWMIYATNYEYPGRNSGLMPKRLDQKKYIASFVGAYSSQYPKDDRIELKRISNSNGIKIVIKDNWHYEKIVYEGQIKGDGKDYITEHTSKQDNIEYNEILSDSVFSLCPEGTGPNTIRLWESMAIAVIPIIISDELDLPKAKEMKDEEFHNMLIRVGSHEIDEIYSKINSLTIKQIKQMQINCMYYYNKIKQKNILDQ